MTPVGHTPARPAATRSDLPEDASRRLWLARLILVAVEGLIIVLAELSGPLRLPMPALALVLSLQFGLVLFMAGRLRAQGRVAMGEAFSHLLADAGAIATLVYLSGGYANPFISLLLVPLILAASLLGARLVWVMTAAVAAAYSLLMIDYRPLELEMTDVEAVNLHLLGMWLNFLITAGLIALFIARLTAALRDQETALAEAREQALRDERLFALGMQAAASAHDLATPVATLGLSLDELRHAYAGDEELEPALTGMALQVTRMSEVLGALRQAAQSTPGAGDVRRPADVWLAELLEHWRDLRPNARVVVKMRGDGPAPRVRDEPLLNAALVTLLNNAADARDGLIEVDLDWRGQELLLEVLDRGPGLAGTAGKNSGWGVGLPLARTALAHLGGRLELEPRPGGGLDARLRLPLPMAEQRGERG